MPATPLTSVSRSWQAPVASMARRSRPGRAARDVLPCWLGPADLLTPPGWARREGRTSRARRRGQAGLGGAGERVGRAGRACRAAESWAAAAARLGRAAALAPSCLIATTLWILRTLAPAGPATG